MAEVYRKDLRQALRDGSKVECNAAGKAKCSSPIALLGLCVDGLERNAGHPMRVTRHFGHWREHCRSDTTTVPNEFVLLFTKNDGVRRECSLVWRGNSHVGVRFPSRPSQ